MNVGSREMQDAYMDVSGKTTQETKSSSCEARRRREKLFKLAVTQAQPKQTQRLRASAINYSFCYKPMITAIAQYDHAPPALFRDDPLHHKS